MCTLISTYSYLENIDKQRDQLFSYQNPWQLNVNPAFY